MSAVWDARTYDSERRRLVPCFDDFYGAGAELIARSCSASPRILDLGAGTGIFSEIVIRRIPRASLHLLDASAEMLEQASIRLAAHQPQLHVQSLTAPLPSGSFDAVISALAIHHLSDEEKRALYGRILDLLAPGGLFINAEQVAGGSSRLQQLIESVHLDGARRLGSSEKEIEAAIRRMSCDRCATFGEQLRWLEQLGFQDVDCFYRAFRFAVFGGWRAAG
jgi:tRNA (cmo5U34)-methyltransferase